MKRTRRAVLASLGTLLGTGCLSRGTPGDQRTRTTATTADPTTTWTGGTTTGTTADPGTTTTTTAAGSAEVTVSDATVTPQYVARNSPDSIGVYGDPDEQFVVVTVSATSESAPPPDGFEFTAGGETFDHAEAVGGMGGHLWGRGEPYGEASEGWVAFEVPKPLDVDAATLAWPGGEHAVGEDALARLRRRPTSFSVRELTASDAVELGEDATVELTVANTGDARGRFVGALNRSGPSVAYAPETAVSLPVEAGRTATWEYTNGPDDRYGERTTSMTFRLDWRGAPASREVDVTSGDGGD